MQPASTHPSVEDLSTEISACLESLERLAPELLVRLRKPEVSSSRWLEGLTSASALPLTQLAGRLDAALHQFGFLFVDQLSSDAAIGNLLTLLSVCGYLEARVLDRQVLYTREAHRRLETTLWSRLTLPETSSRLDVLGLELLGRDVDLLSILEHGNRQLRSCELNGQRILLSLEWGKTSPADFVLGLLKTEPGSDWRGERIEAELSAVGVSPSEVDAALAKLLAEHRVEQHEGLMRWSVPEGPAAETPVDATPPEHLQSLEPRMAGPIYSRAQADVMLAYRELSRNSRSLAKLLTGEAIDHAAILRDSFPPSLRPVLSTVARELELATLQLGFFFVDKLRRESSSAIGFDLVRNLIGLAIEAGEMKVKHIEHRLLYDAAASRRLADWVVHRVGLPQTVSALNDLDIGQAGCRHGSPGVVTILRVEHPFLTLAELNGESVLLSLEGRPEARDVVLGLFRTQSEQNWDLERLERELKGFYLAPGAIEESLQSLLVAGQLEKDSTGWHLHEEPLPEPVPEARPEPVATPQPKPEPVVELPPPPPEVEAEPTEGFLLKIHPANGGIFGVLRCYGPKSEQTRLLDSCPTLKSHRQGVYYFWKSPSACLRMLDEVRLEGVEVQWPKGQPYKVVGQLERASFAGAELRPREGGGWFEIGGDIQLPDGTVLPAVELLRKLKPGEEFLALDDGQFLRLEQSLREELEKLGRLLEDEAVPERWLPLLAATVDLPMHDLSPDARWSKLLKSWDRAEKLDPKVPENLIGTLRDYQTEGYRWLARRIEAGFGVCLADDMGLGKTLQVLCLLQSRQSSGPSLVVAPSSVTYNWFEQSERYGTGLRTVLYEGANRHQHLHDFDFDVLVVSYGVLVNDAEALQQIEWNCIVLDEAQQIKSHASVRAKVACKLKGDARIAVSGTPIENSLVELWSLFRFLNPWLLGTLAEFRRAYEKVAPGKAEAARSRLKSLVRPFILRRTKQSVAPELPSKTEIIDRIELSTDERALYEAIRLQALGQDWESEQGRLALLNSLLKLRQICCHPGLLTPSEKLTRKEPISSKLAALLDRLEKCLEEGHRALIFSSFVQLLERVCLQLESRGIAHELLYGGTPTARRRELVTAFREGQFPVFLISLKAGGTGLTLTEADHVFHLDPWWNPAAEDQATDRTHRIGQLNPVTVYKFVARDTVEERVLELHDSKRELVRAVLDENSPGQSFSLEELKQLM